MKIKEIFEKFSTGKLSFQEAKAELCKLKQHLDYDEFERLDLTLQTLREIHMVDKGIDSDPMDYSPRPFEIIPNEFYHEALTMCIDMINEGVNPQQVGSMLFENFNIGGKLCTYFYNEALDIVRINTIPPDLVDEIGEEWFRMQQIKHEEKKNGRS